MEVTAKQQDGITILALQGRLDATTANEFEQQLLARIQQGQTRLVLDFEQLDYISSAGLRVLLKAVKELKHCDGRLFLCAVKDYVREVFDLSGFVSFLPIHGSLEESLRAF